MKARLNLTIDETLLESIKNYASQKYISVSELVEDYFEILTKPTKKKNIIDLVEELESPGIDPKADLKELYYKGQSEKYGF